MSMQGDFVAGRIKEIAHREGAWLQSDTIEIMKLLGWSYSNMKMNEKDEGRKLQIALNASPKSQLIVEHIEGGADPRDAARVLLTENDPTRCPIICITQGPCWQFYFNEEDAEAEPFLKLNLQRQSPQGASAELHKLIGQAAFASGRSHGEARNRSRNARKDRIEHKKLKEAFLELLDQAPHEITGIIAKRAKIKMGGRTPSDYQIQTLLQESARRLKGEPAQPRAQIGAQIGTQIGTPTEQTAHTTPPRNPGVRGPKVTANTAITKLPAHKPRGRAPAAPLQGFSIGGEIRHVKKWVKFMPEVMEVIYEQNPKEFALAANQLAWLSKGDPRETQGRWKQIGNSSFYVRTMAGSEKMVEYCRRTLKHLGGRESDLNLIQ